MRISVNIPKPQCKYTLSSPELTVLCDMVQDQLDELFHEHNFKVSMRTLLGNPIFVTEFDEMDHVELQSLYDECLEEWMQLVE